MRLAAGSPFDQRLEMLVHGAVEVPVAGVPVTRPACESRAQRMRDRRALGRHELAEQPVGERQATGGSRSARRGPSGRRGARAAARAGPRAAAGTRSPAARRASATRRSSAAEQRLERSAAMAARARRTRASSSANRVGQSARQPSSRSTSRHPACPAAGAGRRRRAARQTVRSADPGLEREQRRRATSSPGPAPTALEPRVRDRTRRYSAWRTRAVACWRAATRMRRSKLLGEVVVQVEQVGEQRRRAGRCAAPARARPGKRLHARWNPPAGPLARTGRTPSSLPSRRPARHAEPVGGSATASADQPLSRGAGPW